MSLASPRLDALTDLTDVPELLTLGAMPQYEARWSWSGNLPMSTDTASCAAVLGPMPGTVSSSSHRRSDRSTAASRAGQDSSSTARRRFLSLVAQATTWSRCDERARAASRALAAARDPRQGVRHAQGGPRDHRGVALVGLGLAGEQARGATGGEPGQVGDPQTRGAGAPHGEGPYVAELVDHDERAGGHGGEQRVELGLPVADGGAGQHLPVAVDQAGPVGGLADVQAEHGRGPGRWRFHGGILPVVVRPDGLPLGTHITSRGTCPALSYQPSGAARPAPAAPNRPSRGQGRSAVRGRPVGGPFWARLNRSPRRARADNFDCNGRSCLASRLRTSPMTI